MLTTQEVREIFQYNCRTGLFVWKTHKFRKLIGKPAGCLHKPTGYWFLSVKDRKYKGHIVAWLYHYGEWPDFDLDHEDLDKANNRISNLRPSNKSNNGANRSPQVNNTSGFKGVFWHAKAKKWIARVIARGAVYHAGLHFSKIEAARAYDQEAQKHFGSHARLNFP